MKTRPTKLTISLRIEVETWGQMSAGSEKLEVPRRSDGMRNDLILQTLVDLWPGATKVTHFERSDGSHLAITELSESLGLGGNWRGALQANGLKFQVAELPSVMQTIITIEETEAGAAGSWNKWVRPFLDNDFFVQAWTADVEYDFWQNASDILEYEARGREYKHLNLVSNGLPYPLEREVIDTSQNPARVEVKQKYIEAIGSEMWLGNPFWREVGTLNKAHELVAFGFSSTKISSTVVKITSAEACFSGSKSAKMQKELRHALFGH